MKIRELFKNRKRKNQRVYSNNRISDSDINLERIEAMYGDFHHECGDRD